MASSTDGYKDTKDAKDFQEWIEINKSRNAHETLIDNLSTSSLSSSSSHELINQCGKGINGVTIKGKKVRFKKKLRRAKDHNLNYRNGYYRDERRGNRPNQLCHLIRLFSTFVGFISLVALIFVVVNVQSRIELLQMKLSSLNDHYHGMSTTLSALKQKTQDHDSLIITLSKNLSACRNNSKLANTETDDIPDPHTNPSTLITTPISSKILTDLDRLPNQVNELSSQLNLLSLNISHCNKKISDIESQMELSAQTEDGLSKSFSFVNNKITENTSQLQRLMALVGHLVEITENLNSTTTDNSH